MTTPSNSHPESPYQPGGPPAQHPSHPPQPPYPAAAPPYQPGPPQPGYLAAPPAAPPKRRRWLVPSLIGGGIALALCCGGTLIAAASGNPDKASNSADAPAADATTAGAATPAKTAEAPAPAAPKGYRIGQTVRGGDFEFVVHGVKCGLAQVGDSFLNQKAQGTFCRADVSVKNVTKKAQLFHADGTVTTQDGTGREYQADGAANLYGNKDGAGFLNEINPGNAIRAFVYFDVPKGTKLTTVTFDAGLFTLAEDAVVTL